MPSYKFIRNVIASKVPLVPRNKHTALSPLPISITELYSLYESFRYMQTLNTICNKNIDMQLSYSVTHKVATDLGRADRTPQLS